MVHRFYGKALHGVIVNIVKNQEYAEDVLQESLVKVWKNGDSYDSKKGRFYTWLLNICRNSALDKVRSKSYKQELQIQEEENSVNTETQVDNPNPDTIGVKDMTLVLAAEERKLIDLVYFQGYSHRDLADKIDMPLGTVKTKIRSALKTLRRHYKE